MSRKITLFVVAFIGVLAISLVGVYLLTPGVFNHLVDTPQGVVLAESDAPALPEEALARQEKPELVQAAATQAPTNEPAQPLPSLPPLDTIEELDIFPTPMADNTSPTPEMSVTPGTATPKEEKTATVTPGISPEGLMAWCLPKIGYIPTEWVGEPYIMPDDAQEPALVDDDLDFTFPFVSCTFVYTTEGPFPKDAQLEVYDLMNKDPWLKEKIQPVPDDPNSGYVVLSHAYIVEPPVWSIKYRFVVRSADGKELKSDIVNIHKWKPILCWDGSLPDPLTEYCPSEDQ